MKVSVDPRIERPLQRFSKQERAKIAQVVHLFSSGGFGLGEKHLKKLTRNIWELRPGNTRLLFGVVQNRAMIVNVFMKKTNKTPPREIELAERRLAEYL